MSSYILFSVINYSQVLTCLVNFCENPLNLNTLAYFKCLGLFWKWNTFYAFTIYFHMSESFEEITCIFQPTTTFIYCSHPNFLPVSRHFVVIFPKTNVYFICWLKYNILPFSVLVQNFVSSSHEVLWQIYWNKLLWLNRT